VTSGTCPPARIVSAFQEELRRVLQPRKPVGIEAVDFHAEIRREIRRRLVLQESPRARPTFLRRLLEQHLAGRFLAGDVRDLQRLEQADVAEINPRNSE
jgi:hypothetical protein